MSAERNKKIVLDAYAALNAGDAAGYFERMVDDVRMTFFGTHRMARTFHGKDDFIKNFVPVMREQLDRPAKLQITHVIAEGDQVVVEAQGEARTTDGRDYNNAYCMVLELKNGKITEIREYMDTELTKVIFG